VAAAHELATIAPGPIARSLTGLLAEHPASAALLRSLVEIAPREVGSACGGATTRWRGDPRAPAADPLMHSLGAVAGPRAWAARDRWLADRGGLGAIASVATAEIACKSVEAIGDARAWELRKALREIAPVAALEATFGLVDDRSWKWRERSSSGHRRS